MFVQNTGAKVIGFGSLVLLPGEAKELPIGFEENHPTIQYYLSKKWIAPVDGNHLTQDKADALPDTDNTPSPDEEKKAKEDLNKTIKDVAKMNLETLQAKAVELGIDVASSDTRSVLIKKITELLQSEQG